MFNLFLFAVQADDRHNSYSSEIAAVITAKAKLTIFNCENYSLKIFSVAIISQLFFCEFHVTTCFCEG